MTLFRLLRLLRLQTSQRSLSSLDAVSKSRLHDVSKLQHDELQQIQQSEQSDSKLRIAHAGEIYTEGQTDCETVSDCVTAPGRPLPASATILKHCRCMDCRQWDHMAGMCFELGYRQYVPREQYHPAMQRFWTDVGMIDPDGWHYCASYHGPQISKDVWVWPKSSGAVESR